MFFFFLSWCHQLNTTPPIQQPSDPEYSLAMDRYLQQMQHHQFLDPDPAAVEGDYIRCIVSVVPTIQVILQVILQTPSKHSFEERFASHALLAKSRWLRDLRARYLQLGLSEDSTQLDYEHRVLCMLLALARNPLHTPYHPPSTKQPLGRLALSPGVWFFAQQDTQ